MFQDGGHFIKSRMSYFWPLSRSTDLSFIENISVGNDVSQNFNI